MSALTTTDPFAVPHDLIADQLEPFCDGDLQRFTRSELLRAYDLATVWADELETARTAAVNIAAEWQERHGERIPRISNEVQSSLAAALAGSVRQLACRPPFGGRAAHARPRSS